MKKTVVCVKCKVPFLVEGDAGTLREEPRAVNCPNPKCQQANEVPWPIDGFCTVLKI